MQETVNLLFKIFDEFGLPYFLQGTWKDDEPYPDSFFTYWNVDSQLLADYDDDFRAKAYEIQVYYYTNDFANIYVVFDELLKRLRENGFILEDDGWDIPSDVKTHIGRTTMVLYRKGRN